MVKIQYRHKLENDLKVFRLSQKVKFYLPLAFDTDLENYKKVVILMSNLFGGTSSYEVEGSYIMENGELVFDRVKIIESFADSIKNSDVEILRELALELGQKLNQESMGLEINGTMYFIKQNQKGGYSL